MASHTVKFYVTCLNLADSEKRKAEKAAKAAAAGVSGRGRRGRRGRGRRVGRTTAAEVITDTGTSGDGTCSTRYLPIY